MMISNQQGTSDAAAGFLAAIRNPIKFRGFLWTRLPSAWFAGLKIPAANLRSCTVTVPYKWFTKNPFRSTYFACLAMAAELSTGVLAMAHCQGYAPAISMLVTGLDSNFHKKATGLTRFVCQDGDLFAHSIREAVASGNARDVRATSIGTNEAGEIIAEFHITWSFKQRGRK